MSRTFYWDQSYMGLYPDTNSAGKARRRIRRSDKVHFEYDASGRLFYENWKLSLYGAPVRDFGNTFYFYDQYGRVQDLFYPANLPGNYTQFNLVYGYDPTFGECIVAIDERVDALAGDRAQSSR